MTLVWKRYGRWAAHAYTGEKKLCNFRHTHFERYGDTSGPPVTVVQLTPSGFPYGRVCVVCEKRVREHL